MGTIFDYLLDYDEPFDERPFGVADAIAFSMFCTFDAGALAARFPLPLSSFAVREGAAVNIKDFKPELVEQLIDMVTTSDRFANVLAVDYANLQEQGVDTQFGAYTFEFDQDFLYVVFRGTDISLRGWQESFHLSIDYPTSAQRAAVLYLEETAMKYPEYPIVVGGHSKGGNLAVFATMEASPFAKSHVAHVYDLDGVGFLPEVAEEQKYQQVKHLIDKYVPEFAVVGLLLESHDDYYVIKSNAQGFEQHDLFTWEIDGDNLVPAESVDPAAMRISGLFNEWVLSLTKQERSAAIQALLEAVEAAGAQTATDLISENPFEFMSLVVAAFRNASPEAKKTLVGNLKKIASIAWVQARKTIT